MFKTAYSILKNDFEAEDAVHEAFIIVIKNLEKISEIKCPQTHAYLIIIVKNLAFKIYNERKKRQYDEFDYSEILDTIDVEEEIMFKLEQKELESILISLPENYYNILFLEQYMG
jgi:RNA polymerase sigma-70 factor (ECF subfamily)